MRETLPGGDYVTTKYWHLLDNGRVQCDLCPRFCKLLEGQRGLCFVRARQDDQIVLTTYGRSSGFCVDPIEEKPRLSMRTTMSLRPSETAVTSSADIIR